MSLLGYRLVSVLVDRRVAHGEALAQGYGFATARTGQRGCFEVLPHRSLECSPCINANIDDRLLSEDRIRLIDVTEKDMGLTKKGKPRVMFRTARRKGAVGIRAVVQWAAAPRPRDQMEMFTTECDSGNCGG